MIDKLNTHYSFTTPASIHDEESLTALQLAGRQGAKINEVVEAQNQLQETTTNTLDQQNKAVDNMINVTMPAKVDSEITKQINNGSFDAKINTYMGDLDQRIDNLVSNTVVGGTTMDAEVIDARKDNDGVVYANLGTSIRAQVKNAEGVIKDLYLTNLLDESKYVGGYLNPANGVLTSDDQLKTSDFIPVKAGTRYSLLDENMSPAFMRFITFYNQNKALVPWSDVQYGTPALTIQSGVYYIKVTINKTTYPQKLMLCEGALNDFLEYGQHQIRKEILPSEIATLPDVLFYKNLYNASTNTLNQYVSKDDGMTYALEGMQTTNYIEIGGEISLSVFNRNMEKQFIRMFAYYDVNKTYLGGGENVYDVITPSNARFVRMSVRDEFLTDVMITDSNCEKFLETGQACINYDMLPSDQFMSVVSNVGGKSLRKTIASLTGVTTLEFPYFTKKNTCLSFYGEFGSFGGLSFGRGLDTTYCGLWVEVTSTMVRIHEYTNNDTIIATHQHGLSFDTFIHVVLDLDDDGILHVTVTTLKGKFEFTHDIEGSMCGQLKANTINAMTNVVINASCEDLTKPLWIMGDSYLGMSAQRVWGHLRQYGYNNYMINGQPGLNSTYAYADLERCLKYGSPKMLVWYLGMNDTDAGHQTIVQRVIDLCKTHNIELIVNRVPSVPNYLHENMNAFIDTLGVRTVDSYKAVGSTSTGAWHNGYLSADGVHPTELGARALAMRLLVDVPEIMSYGRMED